MDGPLFAQCDQAATAVSTLAREDHRKTTGSMRFQIIRDLEDLGFVDFSRVVFSVDYDIVGRILTTQIAPEGGFGVVGRNEVPSIGSRSI